MIVSSNINTNNFHVYELPLKPTSTVKQRCRCPQSSRKSSVATHHHKWKSQTINLFFVLDNHIDQYKQQFPNSQKSASLHDTNTYNVTQFHDTCYVHQLELTYIASQSLDNLFITEQPIFKNPIFNHSLRINSLMISF